MARIILKGKAVLWMVGMADGAVLINEKTGRKVRLDMVTARALEDVPMRWAVWMGVFCRAQSGEEYIKTRLFVAGSPYKQSTLSEHLCIEHETLLRECNQSHIVNAGWIASCNGNELGDELANNIFSMYGVWETLAQWESDKAFF